MAKRPTGVKVRAFGFGLKAGAAALIFAAAGFGLAAVVAIGGVEVPALVTSAALCFAGLNGGMGGMSTKRGALVTVGAATAEVEAFVVETEGDVSELVRETVVRVLDWSRALIIGARSSGIGVLSCRGDA
jgi:hypothetical protein